MPVFECGTCAVVPCLLFIQDDDVEVPKYCPWSNCPVNPPVWKLLEAKK